MARTIDEINSEIINYVQSNATLSSKLTSSSKTALWRLWVYVTAVSIWSLEKILDQRNTEVQSLLDNRRAHTERWYQNKCLEFQYGYDLVDGEDHYAEIVESAKAVTYCAVKEVFSSGYSKLIIKAAGGTDQPEQITDAGIISAFESYLSEIRDAGVYLQFIYAPADVLKPVMKIYYDPQILYVDGYDLKNIKSGDTVITTAITNYLKSLTRPFNGELSLTLLNEAVKAVSGVNDTFVLSCITTNQEHPNGLVVTDKVIPYSGYFELAANTFNYFQYIAI